MRVTCPMRVADSSCTAAIMLVRLAFLALLMATAAAALMAQDRTDALPQPGLTGTASLGGVAELLTGGQRTPVRRARVFVRKTTGEVLTTDTDTSGRFQVEQLAAGSYRVEIDKPGFVPIERAPAIEVRDGQRARVAVLMQRGAAIEGRIAMPNGEPAASMNVSAVRLGYGPYGKKPVAIRQTVSDDLGRFRIHTLMPGDYYVQAALDPLRMSDRSVTVAAMWTYYSGTSRLNEARLVPLLPEQQLSNITFTLTTAPRALLFGSVMASTGKPPASFSIRVQRVGSPPGEIRCQLVGWPKSPTFQCPNVPPGDFWVLAASRAVDGGPVEFGARQITVAGQKIDDLVIATAPGVQISGRLEVEGGGKLPAGVQVSALEMDFEYPAAASGGGPSPTPPVSPGVDGSFVFPSLAGARLIRLERLADDWALKGVWLDSLEVSDTPITPSADRLSPLRIVMTNATGSLEGVVTLADRQPARAKMVIVFVEDPRRWGARSRFIRITETDASGHFLIRGLLPGDYRVAFLEPLDDGAWEDPEVLANLQRTAPKVIVKATERVVLNGTIR
jgi:hypothetical protein